MSEHGGTLSNVEIFEAGTHRGKTYTESDLDAMARNFQGGPKRVPMVIGHDEDQDFLKRSDLPAAGWAGNVRRRGRKLLADFDHVPPAICRAIRDRRYRTVSTEVYDEPPPGLKGKGKTLRRVAMLGGDLPQIKTLADLPMPEEMHEKRERFDSLGSVVRCSRLLKLPDGCFAIFSEVGPMDEQAILDQLASHGVDVQALQGVPLPALQEILRVVEDAKAADLPDEPAPGEEPDGDEGMLKKMMASDEMEEPADEEMKGKYRECAKKYAERARKHAERSAKHLKRFASEEAPVDEEKPMTPEKMSEIIGREVAKAVAKATGQIHKFAESAKADSKTAAVDAFLEAQLIQGRVLPRELAKDDPSSLRNRMLRADASRVVSKFSEEGKEVKATELDLQMREIKQRPVFSFSERVKAAPDRQSPADAETEKVATHFRENEASFTAHGLTSETLTKAFLAEKQLNPSLTAAQFLNQKA